MRVRQLRYNRLAQGLPYTQEWLAEAAGIGRQTVVSIEAGARCVAAGVYVECRPRMTTLRKIAQALGVKVEDLLADTAETP